MTGPETIDALKVAERVLANPRTFRVSTHEDLAMAGCLIGLNQQIDALELLPTTNARLAAAIASFIQSEEAVTALVTPDGYVPLPAVAARYEAFKTLKTTFETEFPND